MSWSWPALANLFYLFIYSTLHLPKQPDGLFESKYIIIIITNFRHGFGHYSGYRLPTICSCGHLFIFILYMNIYSLFNSVH